MEDNYTINLDGTTLTIILRGRLAVENAPALQQSLSNYQGRDIRKVVFDATELEFITSAGVRCIIFAKRELGQKPEIVFENCTKQIHEVFEMTGLSRFISFVNDNRIKEREDNAKAGDELNQKLAHIRQKELDDFATNSDVVCYQMKLEED